MATRSRALNPTSGRDVAPTQWHTLSPSAVASQLRVDAVAGLPATDVVERLARYGANDIRERPRRSSLRMLLDQFSDFMILVLLGAAVLSGLVGDVKDTVAILVIVLLNAVIGFVQEFRAERAIAALKQMAAAAALVIRGNERVRVAATDVVPGDVVLLQAGYVVPADVRLTEAVQLRVDEAMLTGESVTVEKVNDALEGRDLPLGDRKNMAYKGTLATDGRGQGLVVATGMDTELGKIAAMLDAGMALRTPLQRRLAAFSRRLALIILAICALIFVVGLLRGEPVVLMFLTAVSLAVAAIPEALPALVTISLALGARKMVRLHALIRRLPAVETLGSVTYICTDKTGTLTQNKMRAEEVWVAGHQRRDWRGDGKGTARGWQSLFQAIALCNDAHVDRDGTVTGDPTETALLLAAREAGHDKSVLDVAAPRLKELPFDSERKRMTTFHRHGGGVVAYTKGAPENVLEQCTSIADEDEGEASVDRPNVLAAADHMAADGLRVLAVARRHWAALPDSEDAAAVEDGLVLLGLVGLQDPPRAEAAEAVRLCQSAGITPVMITGDHLVTARAIGRHLGFLTDDAAVMTGPELAQLSDADFADRVEHIRVYARSDPAQKIRIVQALQARGEFVAMTGDGVNDAPALKAADIGVAMGKSGTDVAREAASLVLLDDDFATIVAAVREGRRIFDNIRKFIKYTMTSNAGEIWTIFLAPFLGLPIPLLPIHILWINLVTDGLPGLAFTAEKEERGIMRRPPRPPKESIFAQGMWQHMLWAGLTMGGASLFAQAFAIHSGWQHWQTIVFTVLCFSQMGHALAIRSERESLFQQGLTTNLPLLGAVLVTLFLQLATIYVPSLNSVFHTEPLTGQELVFCLAMSTVVFFAVEIEKVFRRRGWIYRQPAM
jgi:Ca2+-transporting ATPase